MYAREHADTLRVCFNDLAGYWDKWAMSTDDTIGTRAAGVSTGRMYVSDIKQMPDCVLVEATSAPPGGYVERVRSWEQVELSRIVSEVAVGCGLSVEAYGLPACRYDYLRQDESDFVFLQRRLQVEGCAFLAFDGKLIVYSDDWVASQEPAGTLTVQQGSVFECHQNQSFANIEVVCGRYVGVASAEGAGSLRKVISSTASSQREANRFAANLLRHVNAARDGGVLRTSLTAYTPAQAVLLEAGRSWDGVAIIDEVRNDYLRDTSVIKFHRRAP
jgi:hypothetical protein